MNYRVSKFDALKKAWDDSRSWEQGAEGTSSTDRGSFKHGFLVGFDEGYKLAVNKLIGMEDGLAGLSTWFSEQLDIEKRREE